MLATMTRRVVLILSLGALLLAALIVTGVRAGDGLDRPTPRVVASTGSPTAVPLDGEAASRAGATTAAPVGRPVCATAILRSPYDYTGPAGPYRSGTLGLPTFGEPDTDFPHAKAGRVLPPETADYENWQLEPDTVYYLAPGIHYGSFSANSGDVFVGGYADGRGAGDGDGSEGQRKGEQETATAEKCGRFQSHTGATLLLGRESAASSGETQQYMESDRSPRPGKAA